MKVLWRQDDKARARPWWLMALGACTALSCAAEPPRAPTAASATSAASADSGRRVYVQRDAQGKAVYSDRPAPGLVTERQWSLDAEDAEAAAARREASRQQAERVTERIQRTLDQQQQRQNELQIEQLRAQQAADALQAERQRERDAAERSVLLRPPGYLPGAAPWGGRSTRPHRADTQPPRAKPPAKPEPPPSPLLADPR